MAYSEFTIAQLDADSPWTETVTLQMRDNQISHESRIIAHTHVSGNDGARIPAGGLDSDSVTTVKILNGNVTGVKMSSTIIADVIQSVGSGSGNEWDIPAGLFNFATHDDGSFFSLEIKVDGTWRKGESGWGGGMVLSDGTNMRIFQDSGLAADIAYQQF